MGRVSEACKVLGTIFRVIFGMIIILSLLIQGSYAADGSNVTNTNLNYTINDTLNGTIIGTINGTINDADNGTVIGTISGTVNGSVNGTISSTRSKIDPFQWVLILPILIGYLLFLCWLCRFFDKMNFSFVVFILIMLIVLLLRFIPLNFTSAILILFVFGLLVILVLAIKHEVFSKWKKGDESSPIMCLHDIVRNFIVISATLMWPMLLIYFYKNDIESVTFYGIEEVEFPIYIIAASTIGALSYLLLSIGETFSQLIPEYKKMSIAWSYIRRILIAPFIALIAIYILPFPDPGQANETSKISIFAFSFFVGYYTKTVEEWVYSGVQSLLPQDKRGEFNSRTKEYDIEKSDLITKLGLEKDLVYMLYNAKVRTIEELAGCNAADIRKKINLDTRNLGEGMGCPVKERGERLSDYSIDQIQLAIEKAQEYLGIGKSKLITILRMDKDFARKLDIFANIRSIEDLSTRNKEYIYDRLSVCKPETDITKIEKYIKCAQEYMGMDKSDFVAKLGLPKDLAFKIYKFAKIKTIEDLASCDPKEVHEKICDCKEEAKKLAECKGIDIKEAYKELCEYSEDAIIDCKNKADKELKKGSP